MTSIERILRYIHSNAYAVVGASGESFFPACKTVNNFYFIIGVSSF